MPFLGHNGKAVKEVRKLEVKKYRMGSGMKRARAEMNYLRAGLLKMWKVEDEELRSS